MAKKSNRTDAFNTAFMREYARVAAAAEPTYREDSKGRKVRVFTADAPLTAEVVRFFLLNNRTVEEDDALAEIGANGLAYALKVGNLVRDDINSDLLWVTTRAAETYNLPKPRGGKFLKV